MVTVFPAISVRGISASSSGCVPLVPVWPTSGYIGAKKLVHVDGVKDDINKPPRISLRQFLSFSSFLTSPASHLHVLVVSLDNLLLLLLYY